MSRRTIIAVIVAAIVVAGVLIGIQQSSTKSTSASTYQKAFTADLPNVDRMLNGIPQHGQALGNPKAPVSIVEYMDYKCPVCGAASRNLVPSVISDYVRTGQATITLRPVEVIDPKQSVNGAFAGLATAPQNRMWYFTELILRNQGDETQPWLTNTVLTDAATTAGVDISAWTPVFNGQGVVTQYFTIQNQWSQDTSSAGLREATPTFVVAGAKGTDVFQGNVPLSTFTNAIAKVSGPKA